MMSNLSWQASLRSRLDGFGAGPLSPRVAVLGIGQELLGDDGAGVLAARALAGLAAGNERLCVIDGGSAPENFIGKLQRFNPDLVLVIDAAQMYAQPGSVCLLEWGMLEEERIASHFLTIGRLAATLEVELLCEVLILGIQPLSTNFGVAVSREVKKAVRSVAHQLHGIFSSQPAIAAEQVSG